MTSSTAARRGRPRSEAIDVAIVDATIEELIEHGFVRLSMEGVATRAGVAKTTLYRRWANTTELAVEAMRAFETSDDSVPADDPYTELAALLERMRRKWGDPKYAAVMRRVAADGIAQPDLYRHTRDKLIGPHVRRMTQAIEQAKAAGLIRADADSHWVRQMLVSPILASVLTHKERITRAQVEATLDTVLRGLAPVQQDVARISSGRVGEPG